MLYDGTVTLEYNSDQGAYGGTLVLDDPDKWNGAYSVAVTLNENTFEAEWAEGQTMFYVDGNMVGGMMTETVGSDVVLTVFALSPYATEGENTLKVVKLED